MSEQKTFKLSEGQSRTCAILVDLIGFSGVHKCPEQGEDIVLDLLPASHVLHGPHGSQPFCVRVEPDGSMWPISDAEAGRERPDFP